MRITGTGIFLPAKVYRGEDLDPRLVASSGVKTRYFADPKTETNSYMAARAAERALEKAGLRADEVDLILSASASTEQPIPSQASLVQRELGLGTSGIPAFDVDCTCLSFLVALDLASQLLKGRYHRVLIVSAEISSPAINWDEGESSVLLGDGAAAVVVERGPELLCSLLETYSSGAGSCELRGGGTKLPPSVFSEGNADEFLFTMDGGRVFRQALELFPGFVERLTGSIRLEEFGLVIPHQASLPAIELIGRRLKISRDKLMVTLPDFGNTVAAGLPMALHVAIESGRLKRGEKVLLLGTAAGFSIGGFGFIY